MAANSTGMTVDTTKIKSPECIRTLVCRLSGLPVFQRPEWSNIKVGKNYWIDYSLVGERILLSRPTGYADIESIQGALSLKDKVAAEIGRGEGAYVQIEDYSRLQGASLEARQYFIDQVKKNQRLACLIFYGASPLLRTSIKLGKRFNIVRFGIKIAEDYFEAIDLALKILADHDIDPGKTLVDLKTPTRLPTKESEQLSIITSPGWVLELGEYALRFEMIDETILHSISKGYLQESHVEAIERARFKVLAAVSPPKGFEYFVANIKDVTGGSRRARRHYMDSLKTWCQNKPFKMYIFYGANGFMRAAAYLAKPFMPFKVELADDLNQALQIIEKDQSREVAQLPLEETPRSCQAPFDPGQIERCTEELIEYIGSINWEADGGENNFVIHPNHPFKLVFEAIQLIKGDLDDLFQERKLAEDALKKSEEKYRELFEKGSDILYLHDLDGNFIKTNIAFKQEYGWDEAECARLNVKDLIPARYRHEFEDYLARTKQNGRDKGLMRGLTKDGREIVIEYNTVLLLDSSGLPIGVKGSARDVTKRIQSEKEKQKLEEQLRQAHKMQAIGTLAGGIAHEFNNILSVILGYAELAMDDVPESNPARENLNEIKTASLRARDAVRQLLHFSYKSDQALTPMNIGPLIKDTLKFLRSLIPATIEIQENIAQTAGPILADPAQINQILIHLCTNAAHAMPDGGLLKVSLRDLELGLGHGADLGYMIAECGLQKQQEKCEIENLKSKIKLAPGRYVQLTVSDSGHGINPEIMDRIFDPYFTTKEVGKGSGMGLAVVYGIAKSHEGAIFVESAPGKGTTVSVYFPAVELP